MGWLLRALRFDLAALLQLGIVSRWIVVGMVERGGGGDICAVWGVAGRRVV